MPATKSLPTFEVDKEGLAKLMSRRGPSFALLELIQNAWDEASTVVRVTLTQIDDARAMLTVEDDNPDGFVDITHAYRLFADSAKKGDAEKRGRFNLGEKLVIAICETAEVSTTTGLIRFDSEGRTHHDPIRKTGSMFTGVLPMTAAEYDAAEVEVRTLIPPVGITTIFNGVEIDHRTPLRLFETTLLSEIADDEGRLKRTWRKGAVAVYAVLPGEHATIYEMGIPVVATDDRWHVDVLQKVPLNVDRDNVTPAYLRDLRRAVLNECHDLLDEDASGETWITDAMEDEKIEPEALEAALDLRFGPKRVAYDPNDKEANKLAASEGYTVISSRSLSKPAWQNVRAHNALLPAGQVTPSPKAYSDDGARTRATLPEAEWTDGMRTHAAFARTFAKRLVGVSDLRIAIVNDPAVRNFAATWTSGGTLGGSQLEWNLGVLGRGFFEKHPTDTYPLGLLIHEVGHERGGGDHLDRRYLNELTRIGADATRLALTEPSVFTVG